MRMWKVDPVIMCDQHLLGEHLEMHMFAGSINKGISIRGYIANDFVEPQNIKSRHDTLVAEMEVRNMNHKSPLEQPDTNEHHIIDEEVSLRLLLLRCPVCERRYNKLK